MKIYKLKGEVRDYDTYDGHVIVAENKLEAAKIAADKDWEKHTLEFWTNEVCIDCLGEYQEKGKEPFIVLSSFNAG